MSVNSPAVIRTQTPESLFRVGPPFDDGEHGLTKLEAGGWMNDPAGNPAAGSLGVLVDDAVGHRIFMTRPAGRASVTAELSMDILLPPPWSGTLRARSTLLHQGEDGGFAECRVLDDTDRLIAVASTWCRYIPLPDDVLLPQSKGDWPLDPPADRHTFFDVLGARWTDSALVLASSTELTNPLGMAHGGVLIAGTEVAANRTVAAVMPNPVTTSVRMNYLRPARMDSELIFAAEVVHAGRSVTVARVTGRGAGGKPCTLGTVTCRAAQE